MKQIILSWQKTIVMIILLALPMLAGGQIPVGTDTTFMFAYIYNLVGSEDVRIPENIDSVVLYSLTTDMFVKKSPGADKKTVETLVKSYLPDATFKWNSYPYDVNRCFISTDGIGLDDAINELRNRDEIVCVSKTYIRKDFKDTYDLYPLVSEIDIIGFTDGLEVEYLSEETKTKAIELIESMGLTFEQLENHIYERESVFVPKSMDVLTAAYQLKQSGFFQIVSPIMFNEKKAFGVQQIDYSNIPFYYGKDGGKKHYLYPIPGGFAVRKSPETDKAQMESIIRTITENICKITWVNADYCIVKTDDKFVNAAKMALMNHDEVVWVSDRYLDESFYNIELKNATHRLTYWGLDGRLTLSYKDGVSETVKKSIIDNYGLTFISNYTIDDIVFPSTPGAFAPYDTTYYYSLYELPQTADVLYVCRSIYETGLVEDVKPIIVKERDSQAIEFGSGTTSIKENVANVEELSTQYFDLLGRKIDSPSGLTIVVTRYSDGTVHTEKKLF